MNNNQTNFVPQPHFQPPPMQPVSAPQVKKVFTNFEAWMSLVCLLLGYLFIKFVIAGGMGLGSSFFFLTFGFLSLVFLKVNQIKLALSDYLQLFIIFAFSINLSLTSNLTIKSLNALFLFMACAYFCYSAYREQKKLIIQNHFIRDSIQALFVLPFKRYGDCSAAFSQLVSRKKQSKNAKFILLGLLIAIPITFTVAYLLLSADPVFEKLFSNILDNLLGDVLIFFLQLGLGIPLAFYFFSMLSSGRHKDESFMDDQSCYTTSNSMKIAPPALLCTIVAPVFLLYLLFFISQSAYFLSAFQSYLPQNFSYAEYARRGFFELCVITVINLLIILAIQLFCKTKDGKQSLATRIAVIGLSCCTILLIAVALSKMVLYIDAYGFTSMRIYPSWFMLLLAALFLFIIIKTIIPKINFFRLASISFVILFALLSFSNIDGIIAKYNIEWYQSGKLEEIDMHYLRDLSHATIPYVIPLCEDSNPKVAYLATKHLDDFMKKYEKRDFRAWNLQSASAYNMIKEAYPDFEVLLEQKRQLHFYSASKDYPMTDYSD